MMFRTIHPRRALFTASLAALFALAGCSSETTTSSQSDAGPDPSGQGDDDAGGGASDAASDAPSNPSKPVGTLVTTGETSVPGDIGTRPSCSSLCQQLGGKCENSNSGTDSYVCNNGSNSGRDYDCATAPSAKNGSGTCTLSAYTCRCIDAPLDHPYVEVAAAELPISCDDVCASHSMACDSSQSSAWYTSTKPGGAGTTLTCGAVTPSAAKSLVCYCK